MAELTKEFRKAFGAPSPSAPSGLHFEPGAADAMWSSWGKEIGSGYFRDRFLYLFGEGLEPYQRCLKAWSFMVPANSDRVILGRNAYGAIVTLDDANTADLLVKVLDPTAVQWFDDTNMTFSSFLGSWLPEGRLDYFLDNSVYKAWRQQEKKHLALDEILAMKKPRGLGGEMSLDNFSVENIFEYYETTAPIYAKAYKKAKAGRRK